METDVSDPQEMAEARKMSQTSAMSAAAGELATALEGLSDTDPTGEEIAAVNDAVGALESAIASAVDVDDGVKGGYRAQAAQARTRAMQAEGTLTAMRNKANEAAEKAMAALGRAMYAAISGARGQPEFPLLTSGGNPRGADVTPAGLVFDPGSGVGRWDYDETTFVGQNPAEVTLKAGDPAGSLGRWVGTHHAGSGTGTNIDGTINYEAVVYGNRKAPTETAFAEAHDLDADQEFLTVDTAAEYALVMADAFAHSGTQVHSRPERSDAVYVRGTYDGAPGEYRCATDAGCSSTNDGEGSPSAFAGAWTFTPDEGAMISRPDDDYLFFGWWEARDGEGLAAVAAFYGRAGLTDPGDARNTFTASNPGTAGFGGGSATYAGAAAGRYAFSDVLDGTASGGRFTADAEMRAVFGDGDGAGITGTIDNFRLNDGTEDPGWSVALNRASLNTRGLVVSTGRDDDMDNGTFWTIGETTAPESGQWIANLYDELPGDPPDGDGSNLPTGIVGHFASEYGHVGRMTGGFGVELEE